MQFLNPILAGSTYLLRTQGGFVSFDGNTYIQPTESQGVSGTYTLTWNDPASRWELVRTPSAGVDDFVVTIPVAELRSTFGLGKRLTGFRVVYEVGVADLLDFSLEIYKITPPLDGAFQTQTLLPFTYDAGHLIAAQRGDSVANPEPHTLIATLNTGTWLNDGEGLLVKITVTGDVGASSELSYLGLGVDYDIRDQLAPFDVDPHDTIRPIAEAVVPGDVVTFDGSGEVILSDSSNPARMPAKGTVLELVDPSSARVALGHRRISGVFGGLTPGEEYFVGLNGGYVLAAGVLPGWQVQRLGHAITATEFIQELDFLAQ